MNCKLNQKKTRCVKTNASENDSVSCKFNFYSNRCYKNKVASSQKTTAKKKPPSSPKSTPIYITPFKKYISTNEFLVNIAKQLDNNTSIVIQRYVNMYQNGVSDQIRFVDNKKVFKEIKDWQKGLYDVKEYYTQEVNNRLQINAIYDEDDYKDYYDQIIIFNKDKTILEDLIQKI
jgi:hypothetical protein